MNRTSLALSLALALGISGAAHAQSVTVTTTQPGSLTHSMGSAVAKVVTENTPVRLIVQPQGGSALPPVNSKIAEFGFANSYDVVFFVTGKGDYEGRGPQKNLRVVSRMIANISPMLVKADSPYKTVKDLEGKRIPGGFVQQKSLRQSILGHLVNAGLSYNDVQEVLTPNVVKSAEDFMAGRVDSFTFGLGTAKVKEVTASVGPLRALPMDTSPAAVERMRAVLPGSYEMVVKPIPIFPEIKVPTPVMVFDMIMVTNANVPDDVVYDVVKAMHEKAHDLGVTFAGLRRFQPGAMAVDYPPLAYHPGAIKYYKDIGEWPPKKQ